MASRPIVDGMGSRSRERIIAGTRAPAIPPVLVLEVGNPKEARMRDEKIQVLGQQRLKSLKPSGDLIEPWRAFLASYRPKAAYADDAYAWLTCTLALQGVASDNFGVGAILVDAGGQVVGQGHNQVFHPHFHSDRHAEMVVMEGWEDGRAERPWPGGLSLYTSLEPCPMCLTRLLSADVRRVLFVATDPAGGMVQRLNNLPPAWLELAQGKTFAQAQCSPDLTDAAARIFQLSLETLNARLRERSTPPSTSPCPR
jgi:tRNA(Arg) A34 adenosine deaminase TadA